MSAVLLVFQYGQPRIFFAMARDGLLPQWAARVDPQDAHPVRDDARDRRRRRGGVARRRRGRDLRPDEHRDAVRLRAGLRRRARAARQGAGPPAAVPGAVRLGRSRRSASRPACSSWSACRARHGSASASGSSIGAVIYVLYGYATAAQPAPEPDVTIRPRMMRRLLPGDPGSRYVARLDRGARRPRSQPQEYRRRSSARPAGGDHRPVRLGQVVARLRHDLRRRAAALRRVALGLRPAVPRADGEAGRRPDRGAVAGDLDRAEDDRLESAVDGRHRHRDLRLPAPAVRQHRRAALLQLRPGDLVAVARADPRPGDALSAGRAHQRAGAGRPRPQGRVQEGAAGAAAARLHQGAHRRPVPRRSTRTSSSTGAATTRSTSSSIG